MEIEFVAAAAAMQPKTAVAQIVFEGEAPAGPLAQALAASRFTGGKGQTLDLIAPAGMDVARLALIGAGKRESFDALGAEHAAANAYNALKGSGLEVLRLELPVADAETATRAGLGLRLA